MKTNKLYTLFIGITLSLCYTTINAQNVAINANGAQPDPSAILDLTASDAGLLIPRMTAAQKAAITSPAEGLMMYQTNGTKGFYFYDGNNWGLVGNDLWAANGNDIYSNNTGNVGIGINSASQKLHIGGNTQIDGSIFFNDNNTKLLEGTNNSIKVQTNYGYTEVGAQNTTWSHFKTDRSKFYMNKQLVVDDGKISSYNEDLELRADFDAPASDNQLYLKTTGEIGIGTSTPSHTLQIDGNNTGTNGDAGLYVTNSTPSYSSHYGYGIRSRITTGTGYTIGIRGDASNSNPQTSGKGYGGYFSSSNATSNYNYGAYCILSGSNNGAAVVGYNSKDNYWNGNTNGSWAGFFVGDVKISGDLIVEGSAQTGWHGSSSTMKILPSDFMPNDDSPYYNAAIEDDNANKGVKISYSNLELYAFISIPEGYSATAVTVYASGSISTQIYEVNMTNGSWNSVGNGLTNTSTIVNVQSTSTNYLAVKLNTTTTGYTIYGGTVCINKN